MQLYAAYVLPLQKHTERAALWC